MLAGFRAPLPPRTFRATHNPIIYENGRSSLLFRASGSDYVLRNTLPPRDNDRTIVEPPLHYHIHQAEQFRVVKGTASLYKGLDSKPWKQLSTKPGDDIIGVVPKKIYHRFQNASTTEELVIDINLTPEEYENEQRFFRNFFGYLDDCKSAKTAPSFFQLMVFLHRADTPLAVALPWHGLGVVVSRVLLVVAAAWGKWMLGYRSSYPEYYEKKKKTV